MRSGVHAVPDTVNSLDEAVANVGRYHRIDASRLSGVMGFVRAWYAVRPDGRTWRFGPSKFVGYAGMTAERYGAERPSLDGRETERALRPFFRGVPAGDPVQDEVWRSLRRFLSEHRRHPNKRAHIVIPAGSARGRGDRDAPGGGNRIQIDPEICGGRPHIRGTRVRVCDILDLLASGLQSKDILADYPYLDESDVRAALAYGAASSSHRVIVVS